MKKYHLILRATLIGFACAAFTITGGYFHTTAYAAQPAATETEQTTGTAAVSKVTIHGTETEKIFKNEKGKEVGNYKYHKPVLEGNTAAIKKINDFYSKQRLAQIKLFKKELLPMQDTSDLNAPNYIVSDELNYSVTYNKNGYLCILQSGYEFTGGAHGMPYRIAHTFDLNTGKEVTLKNIFSLSKADMTTKIARAFNKLFKSDKESVYWDDALATVKKTAGYSSPFYLTNKGVRLYYSPYDLSAYARGYVEVTLHYSSNKDILKIPALAK